MILAELWKQYGPGQQAYIATFIIGIFPVFILPLLPIISRTFFPTPNKPKYEKLQKEDSKEKKNQGKLKDKNEKKEKSEANETSESLINPGLLNALLSFAAGGLLGDVFIHLIPHALAGHNEAHDGHSHGGHSHSHSHSHSGHSHSHGHHHHSHSHAGHNHHSDENFALFGLHIILGILAFMLIERISRSFSHGHHHDHSHNTKRVSGILNLIADMSHNFTDGLALAASFYQSTQLGVSTAIAILIHEIPHEVGDYAILVQSGISHWKAILLQFFTAIGAFLGTTLGIMLQQKGFLLESIRFSLVDWILPFTAGGFIYVAMTTILPELNSQKKSLFQSAFELSLFCLGVGLMFLIEH